MQDLMSPETTGRVREIRSRLPGQMLQERLETAQLTYGPLYSLAEVRQRVGEVLPRRLGYVRSAVLEPIETYRERIPDESLLKYDDAVRSGLFSKFWVATPTYATCMVSPAAAWFRLWQCSIQSPGVFARNATT